MRIKEIEAPSDDPVMNTPLITFDALARSLNVGPAAAKSVAQRLSIRPTRMPNKRDYLTPAQASVIRAAMEAQQRG